MLPQPSPLEHWWVEVGSALSRLLNALAGGDGAVTFSAASWHLHLRGARLGTLRVRLVDWINRDPGHCEAAYRWHRERGLL